MASEIYNALTGKGEIMSKPIPTIKKFMTTTPLSIDKSASLKEAALVMKKNDIRHLPVFSDGKVAGVITSTDIALIKGLNGVDQESLKVSDCFSPDAYSVSPDKTLDEVVEEMAEKKYGCVLVTDHEHLVGIFTWVDALKATHQLLETRLRK